MGSPLPFWEADFRRCGYGAGVARASASCGYGAGIAGASAFARLRLAARFACGARLLVAPAHRNAGAVGFAVQQREIAEQSGALLLEVLALARLAGRLARVPR